jgi:catalase
VCPAAALLAEGAVPRLVAPRLGTLAGGGTTRPGDEGLAVELSLETAPSVLFDGVVVPGGAGVERLQRLAHVLDFLREQHRHCKPLLLVGNAQSLLEAAGVPRTLPDGEQDPALLWVENPRTLEAHLVAFTQALSGHRDFRREVDPPPA